MKITAHGATDLGLKRTVNEDNYKICPNLDLYIVADGMGGHIAGEVASRMAVDVIAEIVKKEVAGIESGNSELLHPGLILEKAIQLSNRKILETARKRSELEGMGTTVVAVTVKNKTLHIASVGDSRIYRIRNGEASLLTSDHSWVNMQVRLGYMTAEEAKTHPMRNVITRALGTQRDVEVDIMAHLIRPGDTILMCTDGLSNYLKEPEIARIIKENNSHLETSTKHLIELANNRGGDDNITVLLVHFQCSNDHDEEETEYEKDQDTEVIPKEALKNRLYRKHFPKRPP